MSYCVFSRWKHSKFLENNTHHYHLCPTQSILITYYLIYILLQMIAVKMPYQEISKKCFVLCCIYVYLLSFLGALCLTPCMETCWRLTPMVISSSVSMDSTSFEGEWFPHGSLNSNPVPLIVNYTVRQICIIILHTVYICVRARQKKSKDLVLCFLFSQPWDPRTVPKQVYPERWYRAFLYPQHTLQPAR